ncbi:MAG TPA: NAD-dependent epimerase/dehydratase family protein [Streptosporangiaceae bacterium]|jgi:UDP-glucose 4-epimerase
MRVLVTGGAGFMGSHLVDALLLRGDDVIVVDDLSAGRESRLDERAVLHKLSISDAGELAAVTEAERPDLVCHLAAQINVVSSVANPAADAQANVVGTVNVLEAARLAGARVLFCSTGGALYGRDAPMPSLEDVLPLPESPYGVAKYSAEQYLGLYNRLHGAGHASLRFANVYGPRQDPSGDSGVIPIFCAALLAGQQPVIYGDGTQTRDFVYVGDAVAALLAAADRGRPGTWNIGSGAEVSVLDLAALIGAAAGRPAEPLFAPARPGELQRGALACERAARDLGWHPQTRLAAGVRAVYQWIEAGAPDRAAC